MDTNFAHLVADIFFFCYKGDLMMSLSNDNQADIIDALTLQIFGCYFKYK